MIGWPRICSSSWPAIRASASLAEPAPKEMTKRCLIEEETHLLAVAN